MEKGRKSSDLSPEEWRRVVLELPEPDLPDRSPADAQDPVLLYRDPESPGAEWWARLVRTSTAVVRSGLALVGRVGQRLEPGGGLRGKRPDERGEGVVRARDPGSSEPVGGGGDEAALTLARAEAREPGDGTPESVKGGVRRSARLASALRPRTSVLPWIAAATVCGVWAVVGLVFWLPLLLAAVLRFSVAHVDAMFDGRVPEWAGDRLRAAVSFYARGFSSAWDIGRPRDSGNASGYTRAGRESDALQPGRLLRATVWALVAWYPVLLVIGLLEWPPGAVQDWSSGPVRAWAGEVGAGLASAVGDLASAAARIGVDGTALR